MSYYDLVIGDLQLIEITLFWVVALIIGSQLLAIDL
jgi:hypothetical protein